MNAHTIIARGARVTVACGKCGTEFETPAYRVANGRGKFCSPACGFAGRRTRPLADRFWSKVDRRSDDECWPWKSPARHRFGYGAIGYQGRKVGAHRIAWMLANGREIPVGLCACHKCDNPACCNPAHIFIGTHGDNVADAYRKGRNEAAKRRAATHCLRGHPFSGDNLRISPRGNRECRACDLARKLEKEAIA